MWAQPFRANLGPNETLCSVSKQHISYEKVQKLTHEAIQSITVDAWESCTNHVLSIENRLCEAEGIVEAIQPNEASSSIDLTWLSDQTEFSYIHVFIYVSIHGLK